MIDNFNAAFERDYAGSTSQVYIRKIVIRESGTYGNQYNRTYESHLDIAHVNALASRVAEYGYSALTPSSLAGVASNMISVSQMPSSSTPIQIANGWAQSRLLFFMDILTVDLSGAHTVYYVQGYTDYPGVSMQTHSLDPRMSFFINNILATKLIEGMPTGAFISADQLLYVPTPTTSKQYMARPEDIYKVMEVSTSMANINPFGNANVQDMRLPTGITPKYSKRPNNIATHYTSAVVKGFMDATRSMDASASMADMYSNTIGEVIERDINLNPVLIAIARHRSTGIISGSFTWQDLCRLDPALTTPNDSRVTLVTSGPTRMVTHQAGMSANWDAATIEAKWAAAISAAVPSLMLECMLSQVQLSSSNMFTNEFTNGGIYTVIADAFGISGNVDITRNCEVFKRRLENEVLKDLSFNNTQKFQIEVSSATFNDTWVKVSIDGSQPVPYVAPTFCDSITTPVLAPSMDHLSTLASSMDTLVSYVAEASQDHANQKQVYSAVPAIATSSLL